jgi:hypothetical protein
MGFIASYQPEAVISRVGIFVNNDSVAFELDMAFDSVLLDVSGMSGRIHIHFLISSSKGEHP